MGFSGIDINMGCPSKKVVKVRWRGLRRKPDLVNASLSRCQHNIASGSVKTRLAGMGQMI